jgi:hypothetical protein
MHNINCNNAAKNKLLQDDCNVALSETPDNGKRYAGTPDLGSGRCGRTICGLRSPDQVSEITMESPGL